MGAATLQVRHDALEKSWSLSCVTASARVKLTAVRLLDPSDRHVGDLAE